MTLLARLEAATEPSWELDKAIAYAVRRGREVYWHEGDLQMPHFTASVDTALTLVPEDFWWGLIKMGCSAGFQASCHTHGGGVIDWRSAATPALALCIAALRAREIKDA